MNDVQKTIRDYLKLDATPSTFTITCFVGMIETGEATRDDFEAVGGQALADKVRNHDAFLTAERNNAFAARQGR